MKDGISNEERLWCLHLPTELRKPVKLLSVMEDKQMYAIVTEAIREHLKRKKVSLS